MRVLIISMSLPIYIQQSRVIVKMPMKYGGFYVGENVDEITLGTGKGSVKPYKQDSLRAHRQDNFKAHQHLLPPWDYSISVKP